MKFLVVVLMYCLDSLGQTLWQKLRQVLGVIDKSKSVIRKVFSSLFGEHVRVPEQLVVSGLQI